MKKLILIIAVLLLVGCKCQNGGPAQTRGGTKYYPIKICSIGDMDGSSCVEYKAKDYDLTSDWLYVTTLDDHEYVFNMHGWAIIRTRK